MNPLPGEQNLLQRIAASAAAALFRALIRLRYRIRIEGLESIPQHRKLLILPNHPAESDPVILGALLWRRFPVRPVMLEKFYYLTGVHMAMRCIGTIPMPDMETGGGLYTRKRVQRALDTAIEALARGENVLLYPSGRIMRTGLERLGGNSGHAQLLAAVPDACLVLVRTRGLFGSIFSAALTGTSPEFFKAVIQACGILLRNLIFFAPRRDVSIHLEPAPADFPRHASIPELNKWLEDWYNAPGEEHLTLVSKSRWRQMLPEITRTSVPHIPLAAISDQVRNAVVTMLAAKTGRRPDEIRPEMQLGADLGLDSLFMAEVLTWLEEEFEVSDVELSELTSVAAVMSAAAGAASRGESAPLGASRGWRVEAARPAPSAPHGQTIAEAFLERSHSMASFQAVADDRSGVLTYRKLRIAVLALAEQLQTFPEPHVGVLLPASVSTSVVILALGMAGKVPVMLNWTAGRRNLAHMAEASGIRHVITSSTFLDQLEVDLSSIEDTFVYLEEFRRRIGPAKRFTAALRSFRSTSALLDRWGASARRPEDIAVILFTSGSESAPKGVPLSHANILSNIRSAVEIFKFHSSGVFFGFLPPFHSFGLTATTLLPILGGMRAAFYPNPNESRRLASGCRRWQVSIVAGTPTFLRGLLKAATREDLQTMRLMVAGAEKTPASLFELASSFGIELLEGYGITECSPVVCSNRPGEKCAGVGPPVPGVDILVADHETLQPVSKGAQGVVLIAGPNVFSGYLGGAPDPFVTANGRRWYNSGDLGRMEDGCLVLAGRKKRFVKIGGEMVSLPAIEEALVHGLQVSGDEILLALCAREHADGARPDLVLFTAFDVSRDDANAVLRNAGFPNLVRIAETRRRESIPLLGTGKVDYQALVREL